MAKLDLGWMSWYVRQPEAKEPCCVPNAHGACSSTCPRQNRERAPVALRVRYMAHLAELDVRENGLAS